MDATEGMKKENVVRLLRGVAGRFAVRVAPYDLPRTRIYEALPPDHHEASNLGQASGLAG